MQQHLVMHLATLQGALYVHVKTGGYFLSTLRVANGILASAGTEPLAIASG
jgi:hypothetical protein